ncbi:MAG: hypothetical protein JWO65_137 [Sphingomonas bacterium]|nr:hypothetical protein [Sphingomonas bacterium]
MALRPPEARGVSKNFLAIASATMRLSAPRAVAITLVSLALLAMVDRLTGPQVNLVTFYLLVTCFASWCLGERFGFATAITTVIVTGAINGFHFVYTLPHGNFAAGAMLWNTFARLMSTCVVVLLASGLRGALDLERWRATTDGLTGALNKQAFTDQMEAKIADAQRHGSALVLVYIDLDGFKGINDRFGHGAGDMVLRHFAEGAAEAIRSTDLFARTGGDEFVALMTVPDCAQGDAVAEMLHHRLGRVLRATGHAVTCSMGALVTDSRHVTTPAGVIDAADRLMYEVKRAGKNAIRIARGDLLGIALDTAYPPVPIGEFAPLLKAVDAADRARTRSAA